MLLKKIYLYSAKVVAANIVQEKQCKVIEFIAWNLQPTINEIGSADICFRFACKIQLVPFLTIDLVHIFQNVFPWQDQKYFICLNLGQTYDSNAKWTLQFGQLSSVLKVNEVQIFFLLARRLIPANQLIAKIFKMVAT